MDNLFFEKPILNSPYEYPSRHWELDAQGQPTQQIIEKRRRAEFITPIPKPKKKKKIDRPARYSLRQGKGTILAKTAVWPLGLRRIYRSLSN